MALHLMDEAPDFTADTTEGTINFHEWLGDGWGILFSHPADFTPVCTTELGYMSNTTVTFPLIADADQQVAQLYDMIHPNANDKMTVRSVFVIGPDKKIKMMLTYPASTGRNFDEILRVVDSLQLTAKHKLATPVNWQNGEDVIIIPAVSDEDANKIYSNIRRVKPYLRYVSQPDSQ